METEQQSGAFREGEWPCRPNEAESTHTYSHSRHLDDLPDQMLKEIEDFFINYHRLQGKSYEIIARKGAKTALKSIEEGRV